MFRKLWRDQDGQILLMFTIMVPVIFGMIGLGLEYNRYLMLGSELQNLADAAALAGAKKLDRGAGSRANAIAAATDFGNNNNYTKWSDDNSGDQIASVKVYDSLADLDAGHESTSDTTAAYVKVETVYRGVNPILLLAAGATGTKSVMATATAVSQYVACNVQPLMLCNPNEPADFNPAVGTLFGFTQQGDGTSPGDFSLLDPAGRTNSGATAIRNLLSQTSPNVCYIDQLSPRPGQTASSVSDGINVRFDMQPSGNNQLSGLDQTPAPNVIKGITPKITGNGCSWTGNLGPQPPAHAPMPPDTDTALIPGTTLYMGTTMDSTWANDYWTYHHGSGTWPAGLSRYQVYMMEQGLLSGYTAPAWAAGSENASPQCAPTAVRTAGDYTRRMISVAIVNCQDQIVKGNNPPKVETTKYADFFITNAVQSSGGANVKGVIFAEFVRMMTPQSDGSKLHQIVQLVRDY